MTTCCFHSIQKSHQFSLKNYLVFLITLAWGTPCHPIISRTVAEWNQAHASAAGEVICRQQSGQFTGQINASLNEIADVIHPKQYFDENYLSFTYKSVHKLLKAAKSLTYETFKKGSQWTRLFLVSTLLSNKINTYNK